MMKLFLFFSLFINLQNIFAETECPYVTLVGDRRTDKTNLRLVQYNVEWLFIDYYSPMNCPGDGCTWKNATEAQTHMDYVAKRIKALNPDIINFCEVEGCERHSHRPYDSDQSIRWNRHWIGNHEECK